MRTVRVALLLLALLACKCTALKPALLDCTQDELEAGSPKCKPRDGDARIPDSEEMLQAIMDVLAKINKLFGPEDGGGGNAKLKYQSQVTDALEQIHAAENLLKARQAEIDHVSLVLLPTCQSMAAAHLALSRNAQRNISMLMDDIQKMTEISLGDVVSDQLKLSADIEKLTQIRNTIELSEFASDRASALLRHQAALLQQRVRSELQPFLTEGSPFDDQPVSDQSALLEISVQLGLSVRGHVLTLLDEIIENFKQMQTMIRERVTQTRERWSDEIEQLHIRLEELVGDASWFHTSGIELLGQQSELRGYLRRLTASQYRTLTYHSLLVADLKLVASQFSTSVRMRNSALPLVEELAHLFKYGDSQPFAATDIVPCPEDRCGVCGGDGRTCVICGDQPGYELDVCGSCVSSLEVGGGKCKYFCDHRPDSGQMPDMCGVCGGVDRTCLGCDGVVLSAAAYDRCGVCDGNGKSCEANKGCKGVVCKSQPKCAAPLVVTSRGFQGCCFNATVDCVPPTA